MDVKDTHKFDKSIEDVFAMLTNEDFLMKKFQSLGHRDAAVVECKQVGNVFRIKTARLVSANVPGFAKKILGEFNKVEQIDEWTMPVRDGMTGTWVVNVIGAPVTVKGTVKLSAEGSGCKNEIFGKVSCSIPLIGGKIADFVGGDTQKAMGDEYAFCKKWLAGGA